MTTTRPPALTPAPAATVPCACTPADCRERCAVEVIDGLLRAAGAVRGAEMDALLDLRWLLRRREDPEGVLALFCQLRRSMEERHYLAFYRLRRWLENHCYATVRLCAGGPERVSPVRLDRFCVEAIRGHCLQTALAPGELAGASRVRFHFATLQ
ncbi:MAG: hypothetical protein HXY18_20370 [Bryobacteraceae bacterium]|nr:hypothetical protein [Bryobacteraceae bacterium]